MILHVLYLWCAEGDSAIENHLAIRKAYSGQCELYVCSDPLRISAEMKDEKIIEVYYRTAEISIMEFVDDRYHWYQDCVLSGAQKMDLLEKSLTMLTLCAYCGYKPGLAMLRHLSILGDKYFISAPATRDLLNDKLSLSTYKREGCPLSTDPTITEKRVQNGFRCSKLLRKYLTYYTDNQEKSWNAYSGPKKKEMVEVAQSLHAPIFKVLIAEYTIQDLLQIFDKWIAVLTLSSPTQPNMYGATSPKSSATCSKFLINRSRSRDDAYAALMLSGKDIATIAQIKAHLE